MISFRPAIRFAAGLALIAQGALSLRDLMHARDERLLPKLEFLIWFGPAFLLLGALIILRGMAWGRRWLTRRVVGVFGAVLFSIGVAAWLWSFYADRGGDESWSVGTTVLCFTLVAGIPGLSLLLASLFPPGPPERGIYKLNACLPRPFQAAN